MSFVRRLAAQGLRIKNCKKRGEWVEFVFAAPAMGLAFAADAALAARKIAGKDCANRSTCEGIFSGTTLTRQHSYAGGAIESGVTAEEGDGDDGFAGGAAFGLGGGASFFSGRGVHHH
jgi:anaerobic glycerol-3-phosphate dehydrogenase